MILERSQAIDGVEMQLDRPPLAVPLCNRRSFSLSAHKIGRDAHRKVQKAALLVVVLVESLAELRHAKCCFV